MYIRATKTHAKKGETRHSYRLVRSDRIGGKVRQSTLLNLGVHFDTPREQWGALVLHIENLMQGQPTLAFDPELQHTADAILDRLIHNAYRVELTGDSMRKSMSELQSHSHQIDHSSR